uniref:Glucose-6-phosphate exchanger SLC37A2 (Trinotate prediction) n=1 Tax=Myxobolus squamalis TaxID=59785 RepID=A0A6B2FY01_MYXSQ
MSSTPIGVIILSRTFGFTYENQRKVVNQVAVLTLTFVAYAILHACRKALPVVKNKLLGNCTADLTTCQGGFGPFDSHDGLMYFAILDSSWAFSYSIGMFFMGYAAEKTSTKYFVVASLLGTGLTTCAMGLGYYFEIHNLSYYIVFQVLNGVIQSAGWPSIIPIVSSWIPTKTMGTILGIWGNHYAVGNMIGQLIAAAFVTSCWFIP